MRKILEGAKEAAAVAKGEMPAERWYVNGHYYVPESALSQAYAAGFAEAREMAALKAETQEAICVFSGKKATEAQVEELMRMNSHGIASAIRNIQPKAKEVGG